MHQQSGVRDWRADDQVIMTTFQVGLNNPDLVFSLGNTPPTSMTDLLFKSRKYMNGEDALTVKGLVGKWKKDENANLQSKKKDRKDNSSDTKASKSSLEASSKKELNFIPLLMPIDKILMQINDDPALKLPKPLSSSSKWRDPKKYCCFHKDYGHYTDECCDLKEQIEELIQRGKLQKFVKKDYQSHPRMEEKSDDDHKEDKRECPKQVVGEIRVITGGPITGGLYRSLRRHFRDKSIVFM